jgi:hypothetical protein
MKFDEAKRVLKDRYISAGLELADEHPTEVYFRAKRRDIPLIRISKEEIEEYLGFENSRSTFNAKPVECSICSSNYREHIVDFSESVHRSFIFLKDRTFIFGKANTSEMYAEISQASMRFVNFFRFEEAYLQVCMDRIQRALPRRESDGRLEMCDILYRPTTIKVHNIQASNAEAALKSSTSIIDVCLFELSYLKGVTLFLEEEFPRRQPRVKPFQFGDSTKADELPLPRVNFNSDIIRFYQRGMSTDDPVNQFLSFYQVLEYYFVSVSDADGVTKEVRMQIESAS